MYQHTLMMLLFYCVIAFALGLAIGWLLSKFLKIVLLVFLVQVVDIAILMHFHIIHLDTFAIGINMQGLMDPTFIDVVWQMPYILSFIAGAYTWRRYLTHL